MPMRLEGSCRCGAISFSVDSHTPYPYQRCYCSICHKSAGGGGYAINIMGLADTLKVKGRRALGVWNAPIEGHKGSANRHYCKHCGTPLWVSDAQWPELVHPFASAIDTGLPKAPSSVHLLLRDKASWVEPQIDPNDDCFDGYPALSVVAQLPIGFLVDRVGSCRMLVLGLVTSALAFISFGLSLSYWWLLLAMALLGLANSVFHPADYAILSARIAPARVGRAFSIHTFSGFLGTAVAPVTMLAAAASLGLNSAVIAAGCIALVAALPLMLVRGVDDVPDLPHHPNETPAS